MQTPKPGSEGQRKPKEGGRGKGRAAEDTISARKGISNTGVTAGGWRRKGKERKEKDGRVARPAVGSSERIVSIVSFEVGRLRRFMMCCKGGLDRFGGATM